MTDEGLDDMIAVVLKAPTTDFASITVHSAIFGALQELKELRARVKALEAGNQQRAALKDMKYQ